MSFDVSSVAPIIIAVVAALGTYAGTKATIKGNKEAAEPANWQTLTTEMKSFFKEQLEERDRFFKAQLAERDKRIDALKRELDDARAYINHLASIPEFKDPPFISFSKWRADR
ncbi:hypothetical protein [Corynebacterium ureicelerivorans]|uniref:hypothetical protein n=1 Tax=Corynebacterium ureicelerivorans TaxID=401472 RepID=UPI00235287D1|nr:hypothetical protein [Corynebacterium ureicelerivorans]